MHAVIVRPRVKAALERITGALLVAIGLSVTLEKRERPPASLQWVSAKRQGPHL
jgi:hypothetical protein